MVLSRTCSVWKVESCNKMAKMLERLNNIHDMCALMGTTPKIDSKLLKLKQVVEQTEQDLQAELIILQERISSAVSCINILFKLLNIEGSFSNNENSDGRFIKNANIQTNLKIVLAKRNNLLKQYFHALQKIQPNLNVYQWLNMQDFGQLSNYLMQNGSNLPILEKKIFPTETVKLDMQNVEHLHIATPHKLSHSIYKPSSNGLVHKSKKNKKNSTPLKLNTTPYIFVSKAPETPLERLLSPVNLGINTVHSKRENMLDKAKNCSGATIIDSSQDFELMDSPEPFLVTPIKITSPFPINTPTNKRIFRRTINLK